MDKFLDVLAIIGLVLFACIIVVGFSIAYGVVGTLVAVAVTLAIIGAFAWCVNRVSKKWL